MGWRVEMGAGSEVRMAAMVDAVDLPAKAGAPVIIS